MFKRKLFRAGSSIAVVLPSRICEAKGWRCGTEVVVALARDKSVRVEGIVERQK